MFSHFLMVKLIIIVLFIISILVILIVWIGSNMIIHPPRYSEVRTPASLDIYYEDGIDYQLDLKISIKKIPENIVGKGCKIREFIIDNTIL